LPELNNEEHAEKLFVLTKERNAKNTEMKIEGSIYVDEVSENLVKNISRFARASISPVASFWGGIIA
jgi:hypothetical protein